MKPVTLWIVALVLTLASAIYQRKTGPNYPVSGKILVPGQEIKYTFDRSWPGKTDQPVRMSVADHNITGHILFHRYNSGDRWTAMLLEREGDALVGFLPHQPPAGKLEYRIVLLDGGESFLLPVHNNVITRFRGDVPAWIMIPHILCMFFGMLVSARAGLQALFSDQRLKSYALWSAALIFLGGMVFGPLVQKFAFGEYWTGFPFGIDLTDNKTLIAMLAWVFALYAVFKWSRKRLYVVLASLVTLVIFLIPHSLLGSELDYKEIERQSAAAQQRERNPLLFWLEPSRAEGAQDKINSAVASSLQTPRR